MPETDSDIPPWFVFDEHGCFDTEATLKNLPEKLDLSLSFFREVPEWYQVAPEDVRETWFSLQNLTEEQKKSLTEAQLQNIRTAAEGLLMLSEMTKREHLTDNQKAVLRSLCFWKSLQLMDEIPGSLQGE